MKRPLLTPNFLHAFSSFEVASLQGCLQGDDDFGGATKLALGGKRLPGPANVGAHAPICAIIHRAPWRGSDLGLLGLRAGARPRWSNLGLSF